MSLPLIKYNNISYNRILPRLNPSFGSSRLDNEEPTNPFTEKALDVFKKILNEMRNGDVSIKQMGKIAGVNVKPLSPLYRLGSAYTMFKLNFYTGKVSIPPEIAVPELKGKDKISKTLYLMNFGHELTHKYQIDAKEDSQHLLLKDVLEAGFKLREIGDDFVKLTDYHRRNIEGDIMRQATHHVLGQEGMQSYKETGGLVLTNTDVTTKKIANALYFADEDDFVQRFAKTHVPFYEIINSICSRNQILARKYVDSPTEIRNKIKTILIKYFRNSARMEKEAYLAEMKIAQSQGYDDKASKCIYMYHAMCEKSFDLYLKSLSK